MHGGRGMELEPGHPAWSALLVSVAILALRPPNGFQEIEQAWARRRRRQGGRRAGRPPTGCQRPRPRGRIDNILYYYYAILYSTPLYYIIRTLSLGCARRDRHLDTSRRLRRVPTRGKGQRQRRRPAQDTSDSIPGVCSEDVTLTLIWNLTSNRHVVSLHASRLLH